MSTLDPDIIWRDYVTDGVPGSGAHDPDKADIRAWARTIAGTVFGSVAGAQDAEISKGVTAILVSGNPYIRVDAEPAHGGKFRSSDRYLSDGTEDATNGGWWERVAASPLTLDMFGVSPSASASENTSYLAALEGEFSNHIVDMEGKSFPVSSLPTGNRYHNGRFKVGNFYYPMPNYYRWKKSRLTNSTRESNWAQGTKFQYFGVLYQVYLTGESHGPVGDSDLKRIVMKRSYDAGSTWTPEETLISPRTTENGWFCFAAGVYQGRMVLMAYTGSTQTIFHRRLPEQIKTSSNISCVSGSATYTVEFSSPHGLVTGDNIIITGSLSLGGQTMNGRHTVTRVDADTVTFTAAGNASLTGTHTDTTIGIYFEEGGAFTTVSPTIPNFDSGSPPNYFHDMCVNQAGAILMGAQRASSEVGIYKITDLLGTPSYSLYEFTGLSNRVEPTLAHDGSGNIIGFLRTEQLESGDGSEPPLLFYSSDDGATYTTASLTSIFPTNSTPNINRNIIAVDIHNGTLYGFTGQRERTGDAGTPNVEPEYLPAYLVKGSVSGILSSGVSALEFENIGDCFHLMGAKGAQVPAVEILNGWLHVTYADSSLQANSWLVDYDSTTADGGFIKGVTDLYHLSIELDRSSSDKLVDLRLPADYGFVAPAVQHRWISDANLGDGYSIKDWGVENGTIRIWKDDQGRVRLEGKVAKTNDTNTRVFTLPVGFKPMLDQQFSVYALHVSGATTYEVSVYCLIKGTMNASADGQILFPGLNGVKIDTLDLSQISFIADGDQR